VPEQRPIEPVHGPDIGDFVRALHEAHGVIFDLGDTVSIRPRWCQRSATFGAGREGGPRDRSRRHSHAYLETGAPGTYATGNALERRHSGQNIRVEHWVVAERQRQTAAAICSGSARLFDAVPFFWSQHYDVPSIMSVRPRRGTRSQWTAASVGKDRPIPHKSKGRLLAVTPIYRHVASLETELAMEVADA